MLHLENFFEKSFALLLTTPRIRKKNSFYLQFLHIYVILHCELLDIRDRRMKI